MSCAAPLSDARPTAPRTLNVHPLLQSGETSLEVCQRHIGDLSEAGVRLSAAFTALSTLVRPPKQKGRLLRLLRRGKGKGKGEGPPPGDEPATSPSAAKAAVVTAAAAGQGAEAAALPSSLDQHAQQQAQGQQAQHAQQDAAGLAAEDQADSSVHGSHVFDLGEGQGRVFPPSQHVGSGDVACMAGGGGAAPRAQHARVHSELAMLWLALPPALPPCLLLHSATKAQHPSKQAWQGGDSSHPPPRASAIINLARRRLPSATPPRPQA